MLADYHVHTEYSDDSVYPMEEVVRDSIALGLQEICFTDHVDYGIKRDWGDPRGILIRQDDGAWLANVDYERYAAQIQTLQEQYGDQIRIRLGLEFGMQTHTIPQYQKLFERYPFDFIILSVHQVNDLEFWTQDFQKGRTQREYQEQYYEEILTLVQNYHDYSVLGHLDSINRYDPAGDYPFEKLRPIVTEILKTVIADGKGIEVNTSNHRYGLKDMTPSVEILKLYRALGGRILTIGSDSHKKEHLGAYLPETMEILRKLGYTEFCTYEKMEPIFHPLSREGL